MKYHALFQSTAPPLSYDIRTILFAMQVWPSITTALKREGIACELNLVEGSMTVRTTRKTSDPYVILKARDLIKLLARSIPAQQALRILDDGEYLPIDAALRLPFLS